MLPPGAPVTTSCSGALGRIITLVVVPLLPLPLPVGAFSVSAITVCVAVPWLPVKCVSPL